MRRSLLWTNALASALVRMIGPLDSGCLSATLIGSLIRGSLMSVVSH
jgi:hypothetical protein